MSINEKIKENVVPRTLFVGLGGTGSAVIKLVSEKCRGHETDNVSFVVLDTNVNDLRKASENKKIYAIQTSNTQSVGDYLNYDDDALGNWFPKNPVLYDKTVSEGAGQVRAISRLAFNSIIKNGKITKLYDAIDALFRKDGRELQQALRVVLVTTAAGGTGSGIVLPLSMFIRNYINEKYPNTAVIIRGLMMLPEVMDSVIGTEVEKDSLRRNAYATVKEINAFMMKGSGFFEIEPDLQRYKNLHIDFAAPTTNELKSLDLLPFDFCFLFDGQNAEDNTLTSKEQYMEQAAQALYEQNIGPMQEGAFSVEDNIIKEISNKGNYGRNRFGGIGASVLNYPYKDIVDYVAYQWAINTIGDSGEVANWIKYDRAFEIKYKEARKNGTPASEMPKRREVYNEKIDTGEDNFSKELRDIYLDEAEEYISEYMTALDERMYRIMSENVQIKAARDDASELANEIDYNDEANRGEAVANLDKLRTFEAVTKAQITKAAINTAEANFFTDKVAKQIAREGKRHSLEYLLYNSNINGIIHPNAIRYYLYALDAKFEERKAELEGKIRQCREDLNIYSADADEEQFDVDYTKGKETSIDDMVSKEKKNPSFFDKIRGYKKLNDALNEHFRNYYESIDNFGKYSAQYEAYRVGLDFIRSLSEAFEAFYASFADKVVQLTKKQNDIVDALRFKNGNSIRYICSTEGNLKELAEASRGASTDMTLDPDLCGELYDAIKKNVIFERETANDELVVDRRINLFDDILLGYFVKSVDDKCSDLLDKTIVEAIAMENQLNERAKRKEELARSGKEEKIYDDDDPEANERYIKETIALGMRLGAPGIQRIKNVEPREINIVSYNEVLRDNRVYIMDQLVPSGMNTHPTDTISKYEMHFFNAIYNITPDKLQKFACPEKCETGDKLAGLYHNAYHTYTANIGPDSAKSMTISTHIDKRWDSVAFMPEIDLDYQARKIMDIHKALIYGLVYGAIQHKSLAPARPELKIYKYFNSDEREVKLIVSNGTPCDEFYEVLDSLYIDHSVVKDIWKIRTAKFDKDKVRNSNYVQTLFHKGLEEFCVDQFHAGKTSLLEIPLMYHNSLPNSMRFNGEINALIDAVIDVFRTELCTWECEEDAPYILCKELTEQFKLLIGNFDRYESLRSNTKKSENIVLDSIFRKIRKVHAEIDLEHEAEELKDLFKDDKKEN
ncbi:MAG: tubulin-like doman-containing protein [Clostridia bacterium]|nr:tubulin-like doman-containing protein [Clostridia bacterium]